MAGPGNQRVLRSRAQARPSMKRIPFTHMDIPQDTGILTDLEQHSQLLLFRVPPLPEIYWLHLHHLNPWAEFHQDFKNCLLATPINISLDQSMQQVHFPDTSMQQYDEHINNTL